MNDILVQTVMSKMILYFGNDTKRINHALKVYGFAKNIAILEDINEQELRIVEISALLHDIGIKESERKYNSSAGNYQELEGPPIAKELLEEFYLNNEVLERICKLIRNHHSYTKLSGMDFQILIEADFLVNIFEDNLSLEQIEIIKNKYFKTETGTKYLTEIYEKNPKKAL